MWKVSPGLALVWSLCEMLEVEIGGQQPCV